ncbi:arginine deiminase [Streptococcus pyogenes]|nr:arginine deiminase [Streptococcus pyogenes]
MTAQTPIHVYSEIGKLKKVLLHRPGKEIENLMPDYLERLLFDDIPFLEDAQKEHDAFAQALRDEGIEVLYLETLAAESLVTPEIREAFIDEYLSEANIRGRATKKAIRELLMAIEDNQELIEKTMAGVQKSELPEIPASEKGLTDLVESSYPFAIDPMPNLYFTRDPFATIGTGVSLNHMFSETRNRETLYGKYIFTHHPIYGGAKCLWFMTVMKPLALKVGTNLFFQKMCLRLVFLNVQMLLLLKNCWLTSLNKTLASRKYWPLNLQITVNLCT